MEKKAGPISRSERIQIGISVIIKCSLIVAGISAIVTESWFVLFICALALFLSSLPGMLKNNYRLHLPAELELVVVLFIYASLFLGEVQNYYYRFWWWDTLLHGVSSLALGFAGFMIMYYLYAGKKIKASPFVIALFVFCFALAIGSLWEIFEFGVDQTLGANMQKSGLVDTMTDLIVDALGALLTSALCYAYTKWGRPMVFSKAVERFVQNNPGMFG